MLGTPDEHAPWRTIGALEGLVFGAGFWRNPPLLLHWFMSHVDGDGASSVARRDLVSLLGKLERVLAEPERASHIFPPGAYGEIADAVPELRRTRTTIEKALRLPCDEYRVDIS